jgi:GMP synthase PP-ATPase subunit
MNMSVGPASANVYQFGLALPTRVAIRNLKDLPGIPCVTYDSTSQAPATIDWE